MGKGRNTQTVVAVSVAAVLAALLGSVLYLVKERGGLTQLNGQFFPTRVVSPERIADKDSRVLSLVSLAPEQRRAQLEQIAASPNFSYDRSRARYLLASDWIDALEGGKAVRALERLEREYPVLAPIILLKRARAYELTNEISKSRQVLEKLLKEYPDSLIAAEALYKLGKSDPQNYELALSKFPTHPKTHQIALERLDRDPNQLQMLLFLARNAPEVQGIGEIRDRLAKKFGAELTPQDWEVLADGYWEADDYTGAISAYNQLANTPKALYRIARGHQLVGDLGRAISNYQVLVSTFPQAEESGRALLHLASLSPQPQALTYLNDVINRFADRAPTALKRKAELHEKLKQSQVAAQTYQLLLEKYPNSDEAAEYRWKMAQQFAATGNYAQAWKWASPIASNSPDSAIAPKAAFWVGKWAAQLNRSQDARSAFEYVLAKHPTSYYAWRSAAILGWEVGNFNTVRQLQPEVVNPSFRPAPPAGSEMFKELYQLGQDGDAQTLLQAEVGNRELTVPERFTQTLFILAQRQYQKGIARIFDLRKLEESKAKEEWKALRKDPQYWQALFPFPYEEQILKSATRHQINPLMVVSLMRQESRFQKDIRSPVGALGLMQVMPATGKEVASKIGLKQYSLTNPDDNIAIGTAYLDYTHKQYSDNSLMAVASYNAGPGNVNSWLQRFNPQDPDWFVEQIPFPETQGYVESVFSNYWNYLRIYNPAISEKLPL